MKLPIRTGRRGIRGGRISISPVSVTPVIRGHLHISLRQRHSSESVESEMTTHIHVDASGRGELHKLCFWHPTPKKKVLKRCLCPCSPLNRVRNEISFRVWDIMWRRNSFAFMAGLPLRRYLSCGQ